MACSVENTAVIERQSAALFIKMFTICVWMCVGFISFTDATDAAAAAGGGGFSP